MESSAVRRERLWQMEQSKEVCYCESLEEFFLHVNVKKEDRIKRHLPYIPGFRDIEKVGERNIRTRARRALRELNAIRDAIKLLDEVQETGLPENTPEINHTIEANIEEEKVEAESPCAEETEKDNPEKEGTGETEEIRREGEEGLDSEEEIDEEVEKALEEEVTRLSIEKDAEECVERIKERTKGSLEQYMNSQRKKKCKWSSLMSFKS